MNSSPKSQHNFLCAFYESFSLESQSLSSLFLICNDFSCLSIVICCFEVKRTQLLAHRDVNQHCFISKYPPAEPEALRLLAHQRGLIATGEKQKQLQRHEARQATGFGKNEGNSGRYTPGILKV